MITLSRISGFGILCAVASMLLGLQVANSQSQTFYSTYGDYVGFGVGVAVCGRTAAVGAPSYEAWNPDTSEWDLMYLGLVNVYTVDAERTRWTLFTVLHADDSLPENQEFGKAIAMHGNRLVIATNATLRIYERRLDDYELLDTVRLSDATIPESAPIQFEKDVLAISVSNNSGGGSVRVFRIGLYGKARQVASLSTGGVLSLDADADTLTVSTGGRVDLYRPHGPTWVRTETVTAPSSSSVGFGASVALHNNRLVVGSPREDLQGAGPDNSIPWSGAVYVYLRVNDRWVRVQRLASNDPAQPSYALVGFGSQIVTSGGHVWITAPYANEQWASEIQTGPASLYRWNAGRLQFVSHGPDSLPQGAIDMGSRYVIEGDILSGPIHHIERAHITDLNGFMPMVADSADDAATSGPD